MSPTERPPVTVIRPPSGWFALGLTELWRYRDLLVQLMMRDLRLRYKQTFLGVAWVVLQPLLSAGIFSFVFGTVADLSSDGVNYFAFSFVGMTMWSAFSQTVSRVSSCLVGNSGLISKVYFPRLVLPIATLGSTGVDLGVGLATGAVVLGITGVWAGASIVLFPVWLAASLVLAIGIGLVAAALMVEYRDVGYILPVLLQLALYGTPIAYSISSVPEDLRWIVQLNPLTVFIEGFRSSMVGTPGPTAAAIAVSIAQTLVLLLLGAAVFSRKERAFADVI